MWKIKTQYYSEAICWFQMKEEYKVKKNSVRYYNKDEEFPSIFNFGYKFSKFGQILSELKIAVNRYLGHNVLTFRLKTSPKIFKRLIIIILRKAFCRGVLHCIKAVMVDLPEEVWWHQRDDSKTVASSSERHKKMETLREGLRPGVEN